jgi:uncharacterized protein YciI
VPYMALCRDDPEVDSAELRTREKEAHFAYIESILDRLLVAGPLTESTGTAYAASLFVYAVDTEAEARRLLEDDPYFKAGIYADVVVVPFVPAAGKWIGGTIW